MKARAGVWLRRYLPAELLSLVAALFGANAAFYLSGNPVVAAVAGAWSETATYYATMLARELSINHGHVLITLRNLLFEFGVAEALDSLLIRPAAMYAATQASGDVRVGTLIGKLAADAVFYVPTISSYELRRRLLA